MAAADGSESESNLIEAASRRLALALDGLEAAAERRAETDRSEEALAAQIQSLGADRARLASELDQAAGRSRGLEEANRAVAERLDRAIEAVRGVLDGGDRK
jgi:chromosome segregation ATPase